MSEADPPTEPILRRDLVAVRHPLVRHPVQGRAPHQQLTGLTGEAARTRTSPKDHLKSEDRHLCQRAAVIFIISLPLRSSMRSQVAQVFITVMTCATSVPMTPDARPLLRRDDRPRLAFSDGVVTLAVVVAAIARHLPQLARHLSEQVGEHLPVPEVIGRHDNGRHLARLFVHAQVQLAPRPPLRPAVAAHFPLALAVDFHARRVHHQVQRFISAQARQRDFEQSSAPAQGRVAGHAQAKSEQADHTAQQPFGGAQRQAVDLRERRHAEDGRVGVGLRSSAPTCALIVLPLSDDVICDPERETSTSDQSFVILAPVTETVRAFRILAFHTSRLPALPSP